MSEEIIVVCKKCGFVKALSFVGCLVADWPKCCDETMRLRADPNPDADR